MTLRRLHDDRIIAIQTDARRKLAELGDLADMGSAPRPVTIRVTVRLAAEHAASAAARWEDQSVRHIFLLEFSHVVRRESVLWNKMDPTREAFYAQLGKRLDEMAANERL